MPYFITEKAADCSGWAVIDNGGEVFGCHNTKASAIKQAVAISINDDEPFEGERAAIGELNIGDYVTWNEEDPAAIGEIEIVVNTLAAMRVYEEEDGIYKPTENLVMVNILKLKRIPRPEMVAEKISDEVAEPEADMADELVMDDRAVDLTPPAFMRAAARRGLALYEEGKGGDGLVDATIREARAMVAGNVTADKWVRIAAWIARHMPDLDAPKNSNSSDPDYPGPGLVAHLLWGSGPSKRRAQRAMAYAERIVARLEAESERGSNMLTKEQRINTANFEVRQSGDGMTFSGYAAVWNSPSEPLPFIERIQSGAFRKTLQSRNEIKLLWNHDSSQILGSLRAGTLRLTEDAYGLKVEADLPDTQLGRDTATLLRRGDVNAMSFGFSVPKGGDTWNSDGTERTLKSVRLFEVSIVGSPAYTATAGTATVRSFDKLALRSQVDEDTLSDVMLKLEEGQDLTPEEAAIISEAVNALTPKAEEPVVEPEVTVEELEANLLELKRKQLELIKKKVL
jgi:HK97 family phage prohead protease